MLEQPEEIPVDVDRVLDILKASFARKLADQEHEMAVIKVAYMDLKSQVKELQEDNVRLRRQEVARGAGVAYQKE